MRPLREKRQQYGGDPTIQITRPEPIRVRHQEPAKISGKQTTLGQMIEARIGTWSTADVSRMTGVSMKQLQRWVAGGLITVHARGRRTLWNRFALRRARVFSRVGARGLAILLHLYKLEDSAFDRRFFLFRCVESRGNEGRRPCPQSLICATEEPADIARMSAEAMHGVMLVEIPNE